MTLRSFDGAGPLRVWVRTDSREARGAAGPSSLLKYRRRGSTADGNVLPRVITHRQWTLSPTFTVRLAVVKQPRLLKRLERRLVKAIWRWQRQHAKRAGQGARFLGVACS